MKKFLVILGLGAICTCNLLALGAEQCNCTPGDVAYKLTGASDSYLKVIFSKMVDASAWSSDFTIRSGFADIIYDARNETDFKRALSEYIQANCSIKDNKIYCGY